MQVNAGPVSQDGQGQNQPLGSMMGRPYDSKTMAIDSQLLQSAHHDEQVQALAAAAQQTDRSTEYAIQQLQGYPGLKDESQSQLHQLHHNPHAHHQQRPVPHNGPLGGQLGGHPGQMSHGGQMPPPQLQHTHPGALGHPGQLQHDPQSQVVQQSSQSIGGNSGYSGAGTSISKPVVGSEEYYRIKKYNHKEVERRRRETINKGIDELGKVVPECDKHKGQILAHAVEYIKMLKDKEETLMKQLTLEKLISEQSINELTSENKTLKAELSQTWKELDHYKRQSERSAQE